MFVGAVRIWKKRQLLLGNPVTCSFFSYFVEYDTSSTINVDYAVCTLPCFAIFCCMAHLRIERTKVNFFTVLTLSTPANVTDYQEQRYRDMVMVHVLRKTDISWLLNWRFLPGKFLLRMSYFPINGNKTRLKMSDNIDLMNH